MRIRYLAVIIALFLCTEASGKTTSAKPCDPLTGDAVQPEAKALNPFKNRTRAPKASEIDSSITLKKMLAPGDDTKRFPMTKAASVTGYVVSVKKGGIETCNCHATEPIKMDTHIDVVADPKFAVKKPIKVTTVNKKTGKKTVITKDANEKFHVIVEVTPKVRQQMKARGIDWTTDALKTKLERHWVKFTGWLLFDREHALQAENTNPGNKLNWRATCNEIHPIFGIAVVPSP